ncbi:hypothetical protein Malapachy_2862 [Malassezia pachydermatis]|uniref:Uncharacterized protein n=1 Tax=Malassezia pachydermatis TaxID=77020 RepID=A0A0M8MHI1_9BASI|nr:hypothetical protein Malapachy_2862 [Malassezia pachydermatis]KOS12566.1 hypothetical protein Malapachy_2862 [Malassezia pachydermatis]
MHEATLDAPDSTVPTSPSSVWTSAAQQRWPHAYDRDAARVVRDQRHRAQIQARLQSAAIRLGYAYAASSAMALFTTAHNQQLADRPSMPRWGTAAMALAAAILYAVLRRDDRMVDVATIAIATDVPYTAVVRACQSLRAFSQVPTVHVQDPALYIPIFVSYLASIEPPTSLAQPLGLHVARLPSWTDVQTIATQLAHVCLSYETPSHWDAPSLAYAMVIHAVEGASRRAVRVRPLAAMLPLATERPAPHGWWVSAVAQGSVSTVLVRYAELERCLARQVEALPWVAHRPKLKRERDRDRARARGTSDGARRVSRADVAMYMRDALLWAEQHIASNHGVSWMQAFGVQRRGTPRTYTTTSMADRLNLHGAAIEAMSDEDVDARLFEDDEMNMYLRTPAEQALWLQWHADVPTSVPAPPTTPPSKRQRIRTEAAHLTTPLDLAAQQSYDTEWEGVEP